MLQLPVSWLMSSYTLPESRVKVKKISCIAGQAWVWDGVRFEVLYPSAERDEEDEIKDNNKSCVLKVTSQYGAILLTGDIEKEAEMALLEANKHELRSDVLIAPHHGSKTSSTAEFVQAVAAKHTIFTVGYLNRFGHPKPLIEKRYEESGAYLYRSDYQGALELSFNHLAPFRIDSWREKHPKYWQDKYSPKN
jgi:competence protein ComEC